MRLLRALIILCIVTAVPACASQTTLPAQAVVSPDETQITLVLTSDVYKMEAESGRGGMARIAAALKAEKARHPHVLIVHAGDTISPSLMSGFDKGAHIIDLFNMTPLDVFVPGNHEFDFGPDVFLKRMGETKASVLAANLRNEAGQPIAGIADSKMFAFGPVKLGVIGLTADDSAVSSKPGKLQFAGSIATADREAARLRKAGADLIVLVPHSGRALDHELYSSGIAEVILSGHDHDLYMNFNEKMAMVEAGEDGMVVVAVDLAVKVEERDGKRRVRWWPRFRFIDTADVTPDAAVEVRVAAYAKTLDAELGQPIGTTETELDSRNATVRGGEAVIGNLFADAMRETTKSDVVLINGGGFRGGKIYPAGTQLTRKDVLTELPFLNKAYVLELSGAQLKDALEQGFATAENEVGRFPQVSGMKIKADVTRAVGQRVVVVTVNGAPLKPSAKYRLATNDYLAGGGDGYAALKSARILSGEAEAALVANAVIDYIRAKGKVAPALEGRIIVGRARPPG
ncbi:MAG: bifunctional metallophosphatase/5'-nucleotidase [Micropepsaceae bacterium]